MKATSSRAACDPRVVIGVPLYNGVETGHLQGAVASLLSQTYQQVALVFIDDGPSERGLEAVASLVTAAHTVHLERNPQRIGLVRNWRRVFDRARELFPSALYFAWGSDHDRWHSHWLDRLVAELDAHSQAVMAYPRLVRINDRDEEISQPWPRSPRTEFIAPQTQKIGAGSLIYGLFRTEMLERAGGYPLVYRPDIYLMMELSLYGECRLVPETLWYRRERPQKNDTPKPRGVRTATRQPHGTGARVIRSLGIGPISRQHRSMFPDGVPLYSRVPARVQHASLLFWRLAILGRGRPYVNRRSGVKHAARVLRSAD